MLCYLIEMAYVEAGDVQRGRRPRSVNHGNRDKSSGVKLIQPAGKYCDRARIKASPMSGGVDAAG
ncbi:hypothetical protein ABID21_001835 [Pseudorhizobium tarimense]|uniref:Transposase n=1 Tax=Pseudorhizobium tarimense TaxID=1079109 RepID=A0ABV2H5A1_9HYPH|nr:hypothetical protein [Pseudorhizobium tarimense]MCJ8518934.1 hypothetical protein [Pseudorhizobium tarimense]